MDIVNSVKDWTANKLFSFLVARGKSWNRLWLTLQENKIFGDTVTSPFRQLATIYMAIKLIGDNVGQLKIKFYLRTNPEKEVENPALRKLFDSPNPLMSFGELIEATVIYFKLHGEAFWQFEKSMGQVAGTGYSLPAEIWPVKPTFFKEIPAQNGRDIAAWRLRSRYLTAILGVDEVLHVRDFDPDNEFRGMSALEPLKQVIDIDWLSLCYNKKFFENDATPGFMLGTEKDLSEPQVKRLREWWDGNHQGVSKAHRMAILEGGLKPLSTGVDQQKMQYIEQRKYNREETLGIFRVPKAMFSITDDLNYATFVGQKKVFWTDTITPLIKRIEEEINVQFFLRFAPEYICKFDMSNIMALQEEIKDKIDTAERLSRMGYPLNAINKRLNMGFDDVPWGDVAWMPINLVPISGPDSSFSSTPADSNPPPDDSDEDKKALSKVKEVDERVAKLFIVKHTRLETQMVGKIQRYFFEQRKRILDNIEKQKTVKAAFKFDVNWDKEEDLFVSMMTPYVKDGIWQGMQTAKDIISGDVNDDVLQGKLISYLAVRKEATRQIVRRWGKNIVSVVSDAITEGKTVDEIAGIIRDKYNVIGTNALRIARTESTGALNGGSQQYYDLAGIKKKRWVTSGDELVRDSHRIVAGESVDVNKRFSNGLDFPGGSGPAGEVINCRCTIVGDIR